MSYAHIEVTTYCLPMNRKTYKMRWMGKPTDTAEVNFELWQEFKKNAPWPVKIVDEDIMRGIFTVARTDGANKFSFVYHYLKEKLLNATWKFRARFIITLMVWNLAYVPAGERPSMCHIGKKSPYR